MKNRWLIAVWLYIAVVLFASASFGSTNILTNPNFEIGKTGWKQSGGTFSLTTSSSNVIQGKQSASFLASATGQYFESNPIVIPIGLYGENCMVKAKYTGGDANAYLTVFNASAEIIPSTSRATLNAATGTKTVKVYFTCPSSGSLKLRVQSTAAAVIAYFDELHLGLADNKAVPGIGDWQAYTNSCSGSWTTNTTYSCLKRRVGDTYEYDIRVSTSGAPNAAQLFVNIPETIDANKLTFPTGDQFSMGVVTILDGGVANYSGLVGYTGANSVRASFLNVGGSVGAPNAISSTTPITFGASDVVHLKFSAPVVGLSPSEDTINSKCLSDIACENVFSASVSASGVVTGENLDWINGNCTVPAGGFSQCTLNTGIFTVAPNCTASPLGVTSGATQSASVNLTSTTITSVYTLAGGAVSNIAYMITCQKTGADFKAKQNIQGFLTSTVTSGSNNIRHEYASVGTTCSSSPCTINYASTGWLTSITRISTGSYQLNYTAGAFSGAPVCMIITGGIANGVPIKNTAQNATSWQFATYNGAGALTDTNFDILCTGPR